MIITLSGITGTGKSFFKNVIVKELGVKNLIIVTTRAKRKNEIKGIDKEFVTDEQFEELKIKNEILVDFKFLGKSSNRSTLQYNLPIQRKCKRCIFNIYASI